MLIPLLTLRIIKNRIVIEICEERLRRNGLTAELIERYRRGAKGIRNFAEIGDEVRREIVRVYRLLHVA